MCQPQEKTSRAPGSAIVEHGLRRAGRVSVDAPGGEHGQHAVAAGDRLADDVAVVCGTRQDRDAVLEAVELADALLAADTDDLVAAVAGSAAPCTGRACPMRRRCRPHESRPTCGRPPSVARRATTANMREPSSHGPPVSASTMASVTRPAAASSADSSRGSKYWSQLKTARVRSGFDDQVAVEGELQTRRRGRC